MDHRLGYHKRLRVLCRTAISLSILGVQSPFDYPRSKSIDSLYCAIGGEIRNSGRIGKQLGHEQAQSQSGGTQGQEAQFLSVDGAAAVEGDAQISHLVICNKDGLHTLLLIHSQKPQKEMVHRNPYRISHTNVCISIFIALYTVVKQIGRACKSTDWNVLNGYGYVDIRIYGCMDIWGYIYIYEIHLARTNTHTCTRTI